MTQGHCAAVDVDAPRSAVQRSASTALDAQKTRTSGFPGRCLKKKHGMVVNYINVYVLNQCLYIMVL